jgi:hypothetical protein
MHDDLRRASSRSERASTTVKCLAQIPMEEYLRNDHICDECSQSDEYPLASTPHAKDEGGRMKDE